jgi:F-type H+-transporting ATPase subunit delta
MADFGTIARPYAKALFGVATEAGNLAGWSTALDAAAAIVSDDAAARFLATPELTDAERAAFVESLANDVPDAGMLGSPQGKALMRLLAENDRLPALPEISAQFDELKSHAENKIKVTLVSATAVDSAVADKVARALEHRLGRKVDLDLEVDATLLGGAVIRAEDMVIDGSVRTRLKRLAETLVG